MSQAMTELIVLQKAFDANSKSVTTSDEMVQKAINMKK
jgi:flagellar hook protein FlgE